MMKNISIRLEQEYMEDAQKIAKLEKVDKSAVIREAIERGMAEVKLEAALDLFSKEKISTSEASEIAGISVGEMMDEIVKRGLRPNITKDDVKDSLKNALKSIK